MSKYEHGLGVILDPEADDPVAEIPTTRCCHCGRHFPLPRFGNDPLSKTLRIGRGFCGNCGGFVCGESCQECKPLERWLDEQEGTKDPTAVSVAMPGVDTPKIWLPT